MSEEIKVPSVGESITEGVLASWSRKDGDFVQRDDQLFEFETDKVTMPVNSPFEGVLRIRVKEGEKVRVGDVVATIETNAKSAAALSTKAEPKEEKKTETVRPAAKSVDVKEKKREGEEKKERKQEKEAGGDRAARRIPNATQAAEHDTRVEEFPPSVRRMIEEYDIDPAEITGTGKGGRVTKEDVIRFIDERKTSREAHAAGRETPAAATIAGAPPPPNERAQTRRPMSPLRQRVAQRLLQAQQTAAMVTTYNEADMSAVLALRDRYAEPFEKKYGARLGFMSFFIKAAVDALKTVPALNARIDGDDIVEYHFYDIGVAVSTDKGLVVPVVRDCDRRSLPELELAIQEFAKRARERRLTLEDLQGGCFSISNGGVFGSLLSAPMLNPPQSGILGMHVIKKRPVVVDDQVVVRPMMYLALTYDHRLVDGREGVTFLKRIVECVEHPERVILEV